VKGWSVCDPESFCVYARADKRGQARKYWMAYVTNSFEEALNLRIIRQPWLDGPGPAREIHTEWVPCTEDDYDRDGYSAVCFEGEKLDRDRTLELLGGK